MDLRDGECTQENPNGAEDACPLDGTTLDLVAVFRPGQCSRGGGPNERSLFVEDSLYQRFSHETMLLSLTWGEP